MDKIINQQIIGLLVTELRQIIDNRGAVLHMIRNDSQGFINFGECYISEINPQQIKAWKRHTIQTQNITVPFGKLRFVAYDDRIDSPTYRNIYECDLGRPHSYNRITIPPGICYGFKSITNEPSLIVNCTDLPYNSEESIQIDLNENDIPYEWS